MVLVFESMSVTSRLLLLILISASSDQVEYSLTFSSSSLIFSGLSTAVVRALSICWICAVWAAALSPAVRVWGGVVLVGELIGGLLMEWFAVPVFVLVGGVDSSVSELVGGMLVVPSDHDAAEVVKVHDTIVDDGHGPQVRRPRRGWYR